MKTSLLLGTAFLSVACLFSLNDARAESARSAKNVEQEVYAADGLKVKVSTGADYSVGSYGQSMDTEILYLPFISKFEYGNWTAKVTVPWLRISGPSSVLGGGDAGVVVSGSGTTKTTQSGLGDIVTGLTYDIALPETTFLDLTGKVKAPSGSFSKGLGTGEADYTLQADVTKMFGPLAVFGGAGYKFVGTNSTLNLHNSTLLNAGFGYDVLPNLNAGATYDWRQSPSRTANPSEATIYVNYKITKKVNVQLYADKGFSNGSADHGFGFMAGYKF